MTLHFKQKEFNISDGEDPNEFIKVHDVVNAVTLKDENNELVTVVIYEDEENSR